MKKRMICIVLLLAPWMTACTTNAISGRSQLLLVSESSAITQSTQEYQSLVGELRKTGKLSTDTRLLTRVQVITDKLIDQAVKYRPETAQWSWRVQVIDEPDTVNAFCMPGGKMAVYTGLIQKINPTDDELAQVMGHEIAHALLKHGAEKMSLQVMSAAAVTAAAATTEDGASSARRQQLGGLLAMTAVMLPNSRGAESEADRVGLELAARAGYQPHAAVSLWQKMINKSGGGSGFDLLSTHPAESRRLDALSAAEASVIPYYTAVPKKAKANRAWTSETRE